LIFIYNQQARYDDARSVIARLQHRFPRNRLLWLELASTELRAGRPGEARAAIEQGLRMLDTDPRPRAFGEVARWHYLYGLSLARMQQTDASRQQFLIALRADGPYAMKAKAALERK
jgi:tetratricopeptide (TPR) repeat protein